MTRLSRLGISFLFATLLALGALGAAPRPAHADAIGDLYGTTYDRYSVIEQGNGLTPEEAEQQEQELVEQAPTGDEPQDGGDSAGESPAPRSRRAASTLRPMALSGEILYFCKWESGQNYDQGLSAGDGYHAMGYFQFDNRYGLGDFLKAVYNYNPSKYSCLKVIGTKYWWNVSGATRSNGKFTTLGNDLNTAWHAAYKADPTEFSNLQNAWAYQEYYLPAEDYLKSRGIDISNRSDSVKSLCWGMCNLFGTGGWRKFVGGWTSGYDWNGNWQSSYNWPGAGLSNSMSDSEFVTVLCDYVVKNVGVFYKAQPEYHAGWRNRYRDEKAHYLDVIAKTEVDNPSDALTRLWGQDAYGTMQEVTGQYPDGSCDTVVVASGDGYWDALSASSLAGYYDCPVLITPKSSLRSETSGEIKRLGAKKVIVVGGPAAVSDKTVSQIKALGVSVERVYGERAPETAIAVAKKLGKRSDTCIVASSKTYHDALSASAYAYAKGSPIYLVENPSCKLSQSTLAAIRSAGYDRVVIMGGTEAIPASTAAQLDSLGVEVKRIGGETAIETSTSFASFALGEGMQANGIGVASSGGYWDALTGSALCGHNNTPIVLVKDDRASVVAKFLSGQGCSEVYVFGGPDAVSHSSFNALVSAVG